MLRRMIMASWLAFTAVQSFANGTMVCFPSTPGQASAYLAVPETKGKHPGLIVIQEFWGVNDWIREQMRRNTPLDQFAREQIFEPLGMRETTFKPAASLMARISSYCFNSAVWS